MSNAFVSTNNGFGGPTKPEDFPHFFEAPVQIFGRNRVIHPFSKMRRSLEQIRPVKRLSSYENMKYKGIDMWAATKSYDSFISKPKASLRPATTFSKAESYQSRIVEKRLPSEYGRPYSSFRRGGAGVTFPKGKTYREPDLKSHLPFPQSVIDEKRNMRATTPFGLPLLKLACDHEMTMVKRSQSFKDEVELLPLWGHEELLLRLGHQQLYLQSVPAPQFKLNTSGDSPTVVKCDTSPDDHRTEATSRYRNNSGNVTMHGPLLVDNEAPLHYEENIADSLGVKEGKATKKKKFQRLECLLSHTSVNGRSQRPVTREKQSQIEPAIQYSHNSVRVDAFPIVLVHRPSSSATESSANSLHMSQGIMQMPEDLQADSPSLLIKGYLEANRRARADNMSSHHSIPRRDITLPPASKQERSVIKQRPAASNQLPAATVDVSILNGKLEVVKGSPQRSRTSINLPLRVAKIPVHYPLAQAIPADSPSNTMYRMAPLMPCSEYASTFLTPSTPFATQDRRLSIKASFYKNYKNFSSASSDLNTVSSSTSTKASISYSASSKVKALDSDIEPKRSDAAKATSTARESRPNLAHQPSVQFADIGCDARFKGTVSAPLSVALKEASGASVDESSTRHSSTFNDSDDEGN